MDKVLILQIFLVIVIISGTAWLGYDLYTNKPVMVEEVTEKELVQQEAPEKSLTEGWQIYRNEELGFEFQYPSEWGELSLESAKDGSYTLKASNNDLIKAVVYHKPSSKLLFVKKGEKYYGRYSREWETQESIWILLSNGDMSVIYEVPGSSVQLSSVVDKLVPSPKGRYLQFDLYGWEWMQTKIIDTESGIDIFDFLGPPRDFMGEIIWFDGDNLLFAASHSSPVGYGSDEILISDYGIPTQLNTMELLCNGGLYIFDYELGDVTFGNNQISFLLNASCLGDDGFVKEDYETMKYRYSVDTGTFIRVP